MREYNETNHISVLHATILIASVLVKFYCITRLFVPELEAKPVVPELITRDSEHC